MSAITPSFQTELKGWYYLIHQIGNTPITITEADPVAKELAKWHLTNFNQIDAGSRPDVRLTGKLEAQANVNMAASSMRVEVQEGDDDISFGGYGLTPSTGQLEPTFANFSSNTGNFGRQPPTSQNDWWIRLSASLFGVATSGQLRNLQLIAFLELDAGVIVTKVI